MNYFNKTALVTNEMLELIVCNNPNCKIQTEDQWFLGCKHTFCWDCVRKFRSQKGMSLCPVKSCGMLFAGEPKPCTYIKEVAGILRALKQAIEDMNNDPAVLTQNPMTQAEVRAAVDAIERNTEDQTVDQFMCSQQFFASQHQCIYPDSQALAAPFPFSQAVVESHLPCSQVLSGSDMPAISGVLTQQLGPEEPLFASQFQPAPLQSAKTAKRTRKSKQIKQIEKKEPVVLDEMPLFASQFQSPANVTKRRGKENTTPFQNSAPIFTQESLFASQFPVPITSTTSIKDNKIATLGEPLFDNREPVRLSHFQTKPKATYGNITPTVAPIVAGKRETKSSRTTPMMGFFARIFGRGEPPAENTQATIDKLRETEEILMKKQEHLEKKIETELAHAKKHGTTNKRLALHALKRKKHLEQQLGMLDNQLITIETQRQTLENASANVEIMKIMGEAAQSMKKAHKDLDIDRVHDLMEDIAEQQELGNEIAEAISSPGRVSCDVDDDDLMKELEDMEKEELDNEFLPVTAPRIRSLPEVPDTELASLEKELMGLAVSS